MMYIAWEHNPQDEFHGAEGIALDWWLVGLSWFVPTAAASFVLTGLLTRVVGRRSKGLGR
jgi:hypothetical protein